MKQPASLEIVNLSEFQKTLNKYLAVCSRELPKAINTKMFFIARGASRLSPKADRPKIEKELGVVGYKLRVSKKTGKTKWKRKDSMGASLAARIVNARKGRAGKPGLYGKDMKKAVTSLIGKRLRAIGTIKAGWRAAIRAFGVASGESAPREETAGRIKGNAKFRIARAGWSPEATMEYLVNSYGRGHKQYIDARTQRALAQAYAEEMKSMNDYIIGKLQRQADKLST